MAKITTAEGDALVAENDGRRPMLHVHARYTIRDGVRERFDDSMYDVYKKSADWRDGRPRCPSDVTTDKMEEVTNRLVGYLAGEHGARRSEVTVYDIEVYERGTVKTASLALEPDYDGTYPAEASKSDRVRWFLENEARPDEVIAAAVGCSRSLVHDIKSDQ